MSALSPKPVVTRQDVGRVDEIGSTNSAYDTPIPIVSGTHRLPGNVIWAGGVREERVQTVESQGGKGGQEQRTVTDTYSYYTDVAIMFAKGPATSLRRIWADGKIIYDATGSSLSQMDGLKLTVYLGTEEQVPNSTLEDAIGEGDTPAYRGYVYIVLDDFPLSDFGNRLPPITAEFAFGLGEAVVASQTIGVDFNGNGNAASNAVRESAVFNPANDRLYFEGNGGDVYSVDVTNGVTNIGLALELNIGVADGLRAVFDDGKVAAQLAEDSNITDDLNYDGLDYDYNGLVQDKRAAAVPGTPACWMFHASGNSRSTQRVAIANIEGWSTSGSGQTELDTVNTVGAVSNLGMVVPGQDREAFSVCQGGGNILIYRGRVDAGLASGSISLTTLTPADLNGTLFGGAVWAAFDRTTDALYISVNVDGSPTLFQWKEAQGVGWVTSGLGFRPTTGNTRDENGASLQGGFLVWNNGTRKVIRMRLEDGLVDSAVDGTADLLDDAANAVIAWIDKTSQLWVMAGPNDLSMDTVKVYNFALGEGADIDIRGVIKKAAAEVNLAESDLDFNNLPQTMSGVKSYLLLERKPAAALLSSLLGTLQIDVTDTDDFVEWVQRGQKSSSFSLSHTDFLPVSENEREPYVLAQVSEVDIPRRLEVSYDASEEQYQNGLQADERATLVTEARGIETIEFSGALTADRARRQAQTLLYEQWSEQKRITGRLPWQFLGINPTDVGTVALSDGTELRVRVTKASTGADFTIDFQAVVEETDVSNSTSVTGALSSGNQTNVVAFTGDSAVFIFDTPLLRDGDEPASTQTKNYWGSSGEEVWNGVNLYLQRTETLVDPLGKQVQPLPFGTVVTPPPDADQFFVFEDSQSVVVQIVRGSDLFSSVTELDVLNGANVLLIVKANNEVELLQFQNVEVDGSDPNRLTLSKLLRGRRGTDTMANGIQVGDNVYLMLSSAYVNAFERELSTVGDADTYVGVTIGQIIEEGAELTFTSEGRVLKPYAPVEIEVTQSGGAGTDLTFTWTRRTRLGGEDDLSTVATDVPLGEDSENYDLVIYSDNTYATELRTINVTSETADYTSAQITADSPGSTIHFRVYQRSAQVGRGFATDQSTPRDP